MWRPCCAGLIVFSALMLFGIGIPLEASAADLMKIHEPLVLTVGLGSWGYSTGWLGVSLGFGGVYVRLGGEIGGTVLDVDMNGVGKLTYPTAPDTGDLWFQGTAGSAAQNLGIKIFGQYKITVGGTDYIGPLPYIPNTDIQLKDTESFTPYMLGQSVTLTDNIQNQEVYVWEIGIPGVFSGNIGVSVTAGDEIGIDFKTLDTDKGVFSVELERKEVSITGPTLTVGDIHEMVGLRPTMTFTPNLVVGITVGPFTYNFDIRTFAIDVPLASLLQPEYPTTPSRSITFIIPPTVTSFAINNDAVYTISRTVALNNACTNSPTDCMASENADFSGGTWQAYSAAAQFTLSSGDGMKQVYFKTRNAGGESLPVNDTIIVNTVVPTIYPLTTVNPAPQLTGTVAVPTATISITVGGQTRAAANNGDGSWTLLSGILSPLAEGIYDVLVTETDAAANTLQDATTNELIIDLTEPVVAVTPLATNDTTPQLSGTVTDNFAVATVAVTVGGFSYPATVAGNTWTADVVNPLAQGTYDVMALATDTAGNTGVDVTVDELRIDTTPPVVGVNTLATADTTPALSGTIDDPTAAISISVHGQTFGAINNGDGAWTLPDNLLNPLSQGVYDVLATVTDTVGNVGHDTTTNELTIDTTPPTVTVNSLLTNDPTPRLTGTVTDATLSTISVTVGSQTRAAVDNGNGTWTLPDNTLSPLAQGVYNVQVTATDAAGNQGHDTTTNELTIDTTAPGITVTTQFTHDTTPPLAGTIDDSSAVVWVTVSGQSYQAVNYYGEYRWALPDNRLSALAPGVYDVQVAATDPAGNIGHDATTNELTIDVTPPTAAISLLSASPTGRDSVQFRVTFSEAVSPTFTGLTLLGTLGGAAAFGIGGADPVYTVTVTPNDPNADGTLGIRVGPGVTDRAGNPCAQQDSALCTIQNWCGFTTQPQSEQIYVGDTHAFSVAAGCGQGALTYQWKWDDGAKTVHDGPAAPTWTITSAAKTHRGDYWCDVTYDDVAHSSAIATLSVEDHVAITAQPEGGNKIAGESHTFSVAATGGYSPLRYQWKKDGHALPEATDVSFAIASLQDTDSGDYVVEITDANGEMRTSDTASLSVSLGLPAAGALALAVLLGACALGGTVLVRRKR